MEKLEHQSQYYGRISFISLSFLSQALDSIENCHPMVSYMFYHFDLTNDSQLSADELDSIEHLKDELCTEKFFQRCDQDSDHRLFAHEWCDCFQYARRNQIQFVRYFIETFLLVLPCELHNHDFDRAFWNHSVEGVFRPRCDSRGYYAPRQCNTETPRECWCVDKHGIEVEGTRNDDDHMSQCGKSKQFINGCELIYIF